MSDIRLNKLAKLLVNYSTTVKPGDFVLVTGEDVTIPWMVEVVKEAVKVGAHVETMINSQEVNEMKLKHGSSTQLNEENFLTKKALELADVWLSAWGTRNTKANSNIDASKIQDAMKGATSWRKVYSTKMGDGSLRWCGTQFPTFADAQEASMSLSEYEDFVYGAGLLDKEDPVAEWKKVSAEQERWVKYLDTKKQIHIVSLDTDIKVNVSDRKWINCDGRVNFPDGEIFTSPVEDDIEGHISFSFPGIYSGKEIEGIKLEISKGKVVKASAKNRSALHWDMLCDMRDGGKIYADEELFYENGKFIESILEKYSL